MTFNNEVDSFFNELNKYTIKHGTTAPVSFYRDPNELNELSRQMIHTGAKAVSIHGKRMEDATLEVNRLIKDMDKLYKETQDRIKTMSKSVNGAKYEVELRSMAASLLSNKLAAIKAKADFADKEDKSRKADYKLSLESGGGQLFTQTVGSTNDYISKTLNSGVLNNPLTNFIASSNGGESTSFLPKLDNFSEVKPITVEADKSPLLEEEASLPEITPLPEMTVTVTPDSIERVNKALEEEAVAEKVITPVTYDEDEGLSDFVPDTIDQDMSRAYNNLMASGNPNIKKFFKYNKKEDVGYVVAYNTETQEELPEITTYPMDLLYPWTLDLDNNIMTAYMLDDFPIVYTEDPIPQYIKDEYEIVKNRSAD